MSSGIYSAVSGAVAKMHQLDVTLHNLANVRNVGFKTSRVFFESLVNDKLQNNRSKGINFTRPALSYNDFSQGDMEKTNQSLDLAIQGEGFFKVAGKEGFLYTRQGNFKLDNQGNLVTSDTGLQVVGEDGPLNFPHSDVLIDDEGLVVADGEQVGKVTVYEISEDQGLIRKGDGLWELRPGVADRPTDRASLLQGSLERSNANPLFLSVEVIEIKRAYDAYMKNMKTFSEIGEKTNEIGRLG